MAENKGHGIKGRNYDEFSGVGTSSAGKTGTTGNLNEAGRDGGVGMPQISDAGNLQNTNIGQHGDTPALGSGGRGPRNRQGGQAGNGGNKDGQPESAQPGDEHQIESGPLRP